MVWTIRTVCRAGPLLLMAAVGMSCGNRIEQDLATGNRYAASKEYGEAIVHYRSALQRNPRFAEARLRLADAYMHVNDPAGATQEYLKAAELLPDDVDTQLRAVGMLLFGREFEEARERTERLLSREPTNIAARIMHANALAGRNELDAAMIEIQGAIALDPTRSLTYTNLGALQLAADAGDRAEATFRRAVEVAPRSVSAQLMLASYYWAAGAFDQAETALKRALEVEPSHVGANRALAVFYLGTNRAADAERHLKSIADVAPSIEADLALADFYVAVGRPAEGRQILERLAGNRAGYGEARSRLAALEYAAGHSRAAHAIIDETLQHDPAHTRSLLTKAEFLLAEHDTRSAMERVQAAVASDSRSAPAHFMLGSLYALALRSDEAIREYTEVLKINPSAGAAQMELARLQLALGDVDRAVAFGGQAIKNGPSVVDARLMLVRALIANGELGHAETVLRPLLAGHPELARVQWLAGTIHLGKRQSAPARECFERALAIQPDALEPLDGLLALDLAAGDTAKARSRIERRLAQAPDTSVLVLAAKIYQLTGDARAAEAMLRKAAALDPANPEPHEILGRLYWSQHRADLAETELVAMASRAPRSPAPHAMLASIFRAQSRTGEAQKALEKVLELEPGNVTAANDLAWLHAEKGDDLDVALRLAQLAKSRSPERPDVNDTLGWVYSKRGQPTLAIPPFKTCIERDPANAICRYHLGLVYATMRDVPQAREALHAALTINPRFDGADAARRLLDSLR